MLTTAVAAKITRTAVSVFYHARHINMINVELLLLNRPITNRLDPLVISVVRLLGGHAYQISAFF